ncbi:MAG: putative metalloprotease CJM1_0395 family protein, partial [Thermodesulfobacteriota bacterium]
QIDTSKGTTPAETVAKMMRVRAAALAPANPSPQDRKVAQAAALTMSEARLELNAEKTRPAAEQQETREEAAVDQVAGEGGKSPAATRAGSPATDSGKPAVAARAASRYLSAARGQGSWHLAV